MSGARILGLVAVAALLAAACGGDDTTDAPISGEPVPTATEAVTTTAALTSTTAQPTTTSQAPTTTEAGVDVEALSAELLVALDEWQSANGAPAVSLSVRLPDGEHIAVASGVTDLDTGEPVAPDDYFRIASITKPMTSAVVLQLVEEGLVDLDELVATYLGDAWLGEHPNASAITVRQLMDHTNGLVEFAFDPGFYLEAATRQETPYEPEEVLEFLSRQDPLFAPGTDYSYETGGFVAAGLIIEAVTGNSAADEMEARLFDPAGAENIYLTPEEFPPEPVVNAYARGELREALILLPGVDDTGDVIDGEPVVDVLSFPQAVLTSAGWTGGGNEAQMESVSAIFAAMFDGTVLADESIDAMITTVLDEDYGLGISVGDVDGVTVYTHGGGVPGFRSHAGYVPEHDIAYAFSSSLIPLPDGTDVGVLEEEILEILL